MIKLPGINSIDLIDSIDQRLFASHRFLSLSLRDLITMKITLHTNRSGQLMIYVPKKDLEEEVVTQVHSGNTHVFTLSNGWQLSVDELSIPLETPQTVRARRLN